MPPKFDRAPGLAAAQLGGLRDPFYSFAQPLSKQVLRFARPLRTVSRAKSNANCRLFRV